MLLIVTTVANMRIEGQLPQREETVCYPTDGRYALLQSLVLLSYRQLPTKAYSSSMAQPGTARLHYYIVFIK